MKNNIEIWKSIDLSTAITRKGYSVDGLLGILRKYEDANEVVDLVNISPKELGIKRKVINLGEIYNIATKKGLMLCHPKVGPVLRELYWDQPKGEVLYIGSKPLTSRISHEFQIFTLIHERLYDEFWLTHESGDMDYPYKSSCRFVFQKKKT